MAAKTDAKKDETTTAQVLTIPAGAKRTLTSLTKKLVQADGRAAEVLKKRNALRVSLGRAIGTTVATMLATGATAEDIQTTIIGHLAENGLRGESGAPLTWEYVQTWPQAAAVYDGLSEGVRDSFDSVTALMALRSAKKDDRETLAQTLADAGTTGVRDIRTAVAESKRDEGDEDRAERDEKNRKGMLSWLRETYESVPPFPSNVAEDDHETRDLYTTAVALIGAALGRRYPGRESQYAQVLETFFYSGPVSDEDPDK